MRVLVVDNYDSYTFNLVQLIAEITGRFPRVVKNDALTEAEILARDFDCAVISPGPGAPDVARDVGACEFLLTAFSDLPVLGVCLGHQLLAHAFGGRVVRSPRPTHGRCSAIRHEGRGL